MLTPLLNKQIADLHLDYSYGDMLLALQYFYKYSSGSQESASVEKQTIGIIPYIIDEAKRFQALMDNVSEISSDYKSEENVILVRIHEPNRSIPINYSIEDL